MPERRVRSTGRPVYGRSQAWRSQRPRRQPWPGFSRRLSRWMVLVVAGLAVAGGIINYFEIKTVNVKSAVAGVQLQQEVMAVIEAQWRLHNMLTTDATVIEGQLEQKDPRVKQVEVRRRWPRSLEVTVSLKQPSLAWLSGGQVFVLDHDGTAIGMLEPGVSLPVVADGSNLPVKLGVPVVSTRFIDFVNGVGPGLSQLGIGVGELAVKETTLDLYVRTQTGYMIIFDTSRPVGEEIADLKTVRAALAAQRATPAEYIDLRVAGKAYYK